MRDPFNDIYGKPSQADELVGLIVMTVLLAVLVACGVAALVAGVVMIFS